MCVGEIVMLTCAWQSAAHIHMYVCSELCACTVAISSGVVLTVCWDYCVHSTVCALRTTYYAVTHCMYEVVQ